MSDQLRINGNLFSWGSTKLKINSEPYTGITSIAYGDSLEVTKGYGMARHHAPIGRSSGKYTPDPLTMTMFQSSADVLREQIRLLSPTGNSIGTPNFPIVLQYIEPGLGPVDVVFNQCRLIKFSVSLDEGPDAVMEDVEFDVMSIVRNGAVLFDDRQG